jgi:PAS domain S-box-containing protein
MLLSSEELPAPLLAPVPRRIVGNMHPPLSTPPVAADPVVADALRLIRERAPDVLNAIDDGIYCLDPAGRTIFVNESASRLLGYTNREILGKPMHELTHHHYADGSVFPASECPIRFSASDAVQHRVGGDTFWTKAGKSLPVDYTSIPIKDGRNVVAVVVTFRDISDQQRVEEQALRLRREDEALAAASAAREALRESEARYRFLAEAIPVLVWTALPDGQLDYVTERTGRYFGLSPETLLRDGWKNVVHPDDLPEVASRWAHSLQTGEPYKVEFRLRGADGEYRWHVGNALAQLDDEGRVVHWFGTNTDISDQKRAGTMV